jgi:hypothetical protein
VSDTFRLVPTRGALIVNTNEARVTVDLLSLSEADVGTLWAALEWRLTREPRRQSIGRQHSAPSM